MPADVLPGALAEAIEAALLATSVPQSLHLDHEALDHLGMDYVRSAPHRSQWGDQWVERYPAREP